MLHERDPALVAVRDLVERCRAGTGGTLFLTGVAGIGKSSLLDAAAAMGDGLPIHRVQGSAMERQVGLAFARSAFGPLLPEEGTFRTPQDRRDAVHDLAHAAVRSWGDAGPSLLLADDVHWADDDSLSLLGFVARRLGSHPVAIVAAVRPWPRPASDLVDRLVAAGDATAVRVGDLTREASEAVVREQAGAAIDADTLDRALDLAGGNPHLLSEVGAAIRDGERVPESEGRDEARRALLLRHLDGMAPVAWECARAAAIFEGPFRLSTVQAVADLSDDELADAIDILVAAGVVDDVGDGRAAFSHALIAEALEGDLPPGRRRLNHRRAFAWYARHDDPVSAAPHARAGDLHGDQEAIAVVARAGELALRGGALNAGVDHLAAAVELAGTNVQPSLRSRYGDALMAVSRPLDAASVYQALIAEGEAEGPELTSKLARAQVYAGHLADALASYDTVLSLLPPGSPLLAGALAERAHVVWERSGPAAALSELDAGAAAAGAATHPAIGVLRGFFRMESGHADGFAAVETGADIARSRDGAASFSTSVLRATTLGVAERFADAHAVVDAAMAQTGGFATWSTIGLHIARLTMQLNEGRLTEVAEATSDLVDHLDPASFNYPRVLLLRVQSLVGLGRLEEAGRCHATARTDRALHSWFGTLSITIAEGQRLLVEHQPDAAVAAYLEVETVVDKVGVGSLGSPRWAAGLLEAAARAGRDDVLARLADWLDRRGTGMPCRWPAAFALAARAVVAGNQGEDSTAIELHQAALDVPLANPLDRAEALLRYGGWLRRTRDPVGARPLLAEAVSLAAAQGAVPLAGRARHELITAGGRHRVPRDRTSLTPQERRVADLAVGGATTREIASALFLSPRTVETHLSSTYRKLGVRSRAELRRHQRG